MPLRSYHACLPLEGRIEYETLEQLAREGKLAGTYKQGRNWWINLLAHMQLGLETTRNDQDEIEEDGCEAPEKREGQRQHRDPRAKVLREDTKQRGGRTLQRPIRNARES